MISMINDFRCVLPTACKVDNIFCMFVSKIRLLNYVHAVGTGF